MPVELTPELTDLAAVRAQISETDSAIAALAADLPDVQLRSVLGKPAEEGDEALLERHRQLIAKLETLRSAETAALKAVENAELQRKAAAMETSRRGYDQHVGAIRRHMAAAQAAMETMWDEYMKGCAAARSAVGSLPPGPMAARGGPGRSILNVAFLQRLMAVHLIRTQRLAGDEQTWILRSSAGTLEFMSRGRIPPLSEIVEKDALALKDLFARDWLRATTAPPAPKSKPPEPLNLAINASSTEFSPRKAEPDLGVVNLSSTDFSPRKDAEPDPEQPE